MFKQYKLKKLQISAGSICGAAVHYRCYGGGQCETVGSEQTDHRYCRWSGSHGDRFTD